MAKPTHGIRYAEVSRESSETRVEVVLDLDGGSRQDVSTGIGFLDHMIKLMAFHGQFDLGMTCEGDLQVDDHHSAEDCGIVLGQAFARVLADDMSICRYGSNHTVMDEALALIAIDVSGRGVLVFEVEWKRENLGELSTECIREFFRSMAMHSGITMHIHKVAGINDHHVAEAIFKGMGQAIYQATRASERPKGSSTKGKRD